MSLLNNEKKCQKINCIILFLYLLPPLATALTGCASKETFVVREDYIAAKEKQWLKKAYRIDNKDWIYLHIEGEPFERGFHAAT